ncbi:MAG TPA: hypothetical protein DCX14_10245 [Flavobacteriales bacterium]|jgi:hypothetical protein|nr:DUF1883 domain-containing protein [Flavobacteriales bacterium]MDB9701175.1 DUF1883 domain-containing protein [Salibacteraceae bacterium]HAW20552.1 hypothetical protein [Flavobacteriales bacterium]
MRFLHGKIKAQSGEKIKVSISKPTRILIMPMREFKKYKENFTFTYFGGQKEDSYEFTVPKAGTWIVVVEKGTYLKPIDIEVKISKESAPAAAPKRKEKKKNKKKEVEAPELEDAAGSEEVKE